MMVLSETPTHGDDYVAQFRLRIADPTVGEMCIFAQVPSGQRTDWHDPGRDGSIGGVVFPVSGTECCG